MPSNPSTCACGGALTGSAVYDNAELLRVASPTVGVSQRAPCDHYLGRLGDDGAGNSPNSPLGSTALIASRSSSGSKSMASTPPQGGTMARIAGSTSIAVSLAVRGGRGGACDSGAVHAVAR